VIRKGEQRGATCRRGLAAVKWGREEELPHQGKGGGWVAPLTLRGHKRQVHVDKAPGEVRER
jgi:hypothetical protein